jgi:PIN domain nuclease of toxin-antitoxin system
MSRFLLDTHIFVWLKTGERSLLPDVLAAISHPANTALVSLASAWELCIKAATGKLGGDAHSLIGDEARFNSVLSESGLGLLPILPTHIFMLRHLPLHHRDPFDRLMIAQAIAERMTLISADTRLRDYTDLNLLVGA